VDTSQYLSMFLEESIDNLQTLNDSLLELEQEPDNIDKLNEIFRVAHTIKGMAATMGFNEMAELTHKMEDVLSEFREGKLKVTQQVVTVLFKCLDTLEQMVNNISEGLEEATSIEDIMSSLEAIVQGGEEQSSEEKEELSSTKKEVEAENKLESEINEYDINVIKQAEDKGFNAYEIKVILDENTLLKSARAFLIFKSLEEFGEIIKCVPSADDLENENFDFEIQLLYVTHKNKKDIKELLVNISEVAEVEVKDMQISKNTDSNNIKKVPQKTNVQKQDKVQDATSKNSVNSIKPKEVDKNTDNRKHKKSSPICKS